MVPVVPILGAASYWQRPGSGRSGGHRARDRDDRAAEPEIIRIPVVPARGAPAARYRTYRLTTGYLRALRLLGVSAEEFSRTSAASVSVRKRLSAGQPFSHGREERVLSGLFVGYFGGRRDAEESGIRSVSVSPDEAMIRTLGGSRRAEESGPLLTAAVMYRRSRISPLSVDVLSPRISRGVFRILAPFGAIYERGGQVPSGGEDEEEPPPHEMMRSQTKDGRAFPKQSSHPW